MSEEREGAVREDAERDLSVTPLAGCPPDIGRGLWCLEDTRRRTKESLDGLDQRTLDWTAPAGGNSIGTLLYHLAAIELDWLYAEVLEAPEPWPEEVTRLFPVDVRDERGRLTPVGGVPLADHLARLDLVRARLLATFRAMPIADFRRPRRLPAYNVTPEWVLHHLSQHEAEHRGHIALLRSWAEGTPAPG